MTSFSDLVGPALQYLLGLRFDFGERLLFRSGSKAGDVRIGGAKQTLFQTWFTVSFEPGISF
jgi:hypothetical protein